MSAQVRDMVFNMRNDLDPYGIQLGFAIDAVSALRGTVSAAASDANNYSDQGITIYGVSLSPCSSCLFSDIKQVIHLLVSNWYLAATCTAADSSSCMHAISAPACYYWCSIVCCRYMHYCMQTLLSVGQVCFVPNRSCHMAD